MEALDSVKIDVVCPPVPSAVSHGASVAVLGDVRQASQCSCGQYDFSFGLVFSGCIRTRTPKKLRKFGP